MKKRWLLIIGIVVLSILIYSQRISIIANLAERAIETRLSVNHIATLEDGLHLALCGAGSPMAAPKASGSCVAVVAGQRLFVVDAGSNGRSVLQRMGFDPGDIQAVFLTHFHSDHIDGLGNFGVARWAGGDFLSPLPVYGPQGVESVVDGFNEAYAQDVVYRHEHHGDLVAPLAGAGLKAQPFVQPAIGELLTVYSQDGLTVEVLAVEHDPVEPAVGYLFRYKGRSLLISGDTVKSANLQHFAEGVDLLVHEGLSKNLVNMMERAMEKVGNRIGAKILYDIIDYHATPVEAAEIARDAGVGHLLYYHIVPPIMFPGQEALYLNGAEDIFPDYTVGQDGVAFSLPANSDNIIRTRDGL
ncbi:MBL fold metallo-hydrolase [uncultured Oceanicoccus sp.]|uniref:MBL fold metallo-hydrolase n=1 Tax=uncultured Oceanicoccus sp. TaxID=1706381 RepID=UPI0030DDA1FC